MSNLTLQKTDETLKPQEGKTLLSKPSDVRMIDPSDPNFDELEETFEIAPMSRTSINDSKLPTPDQEIFLTQRNLVRNSLRVMMIPKHYNRFLKTS